MVIFRNILAVIIGFFVGNVVNMGLVQTGYSVYPLKGVDLNDMAALAEVIPTLSAEHFIFPFLAHALGTFFGAIVAGLIAANHKMKFSLSIGGLFLIGGIMINFMLPGPTWFAILDIAVAYIPMAWIGGKIALKFSQKRSV